MKSSEIKNAHEIVRTIQYILAKQKSLKLPSEKLAEYIYEQALNKLQDKFKNNTFNLPKDKYLLIEVIEKGDEDYDSLGDMLFLKKYADIITNRIIIKIGKTSKISPKKNEAFISCYAAEKKECLNSEIFLCGKKNSHRTILRYENIIQYRELKLTDGPLIMNWAWIAESLKRELFMYRKNIQ